MQHKELSTTAVGQNKFKHIFMATSYIFLMFQIEEEIIRYKQEARVSPDEDPLAWWKAHKMAYPHLVHVAKIYLSVPGTSVPSERVFSTAGDVVSGQRALLGAESVDRLIFIKKNYKM